MPKLAREHLGCSPAKQNKQAIFLHAQVMYLSNEYFGVPF